MGVDHLYAVITYTTVIAFITFVIFTPSRRHQAGPRHDRPQ
jgi:hypothetical protein